MKMARQCNKCMNEGKVLGYEDEYCRCMFGRQLRAKHDQMLNESKRAIEEAKEIEKGTKAMKKKKSQPNYAVSEGDWTKHGNVYGVVGQMKGEQFLFLSSHVYGQVSGKREETYKKFWVDTAKYLPAPIETFDNERELYAQMAFITGDTTLFSEATEGLYENKETRDECLKLMVEWALKFKDEEMFMFATNKMKKVKK